MSAIKKEATGWEPGGLIWGDRCAAVDESGDSRRLLLE
jgi:hypothetical protein